MLRRQGSCWVDHLKKKGTVRGRSMTGGRCGNVTPARFPKTNLFSGKLGRQIGGNNYTLESWEFNSSREGNSGCDRPPISSPEKAGQRRYQGGEYEYRAQKTEEENNVILGYRGEDNCSFVPGVPAWEKNRGGVDGKNERVPTL